MAYMSRPVAARALKSAAGANLGSSSSTIRRRTHLGGVDRGSEPCSCARRITPLALPVLFDHHELLFAMTGLLGVSSIAVALFSDTAGAQRPLDGASNRFQERCNVRWESGRPAPLATTSSQIRPSLVEEKTVPDAGSVVAGGQP